MALFAVTTQEQSEQRAADDIISQGGDAIFAVVAPHSLNGYFFVEAASRNVVEDAVKRVTYTKKVLPGETSLSEVESFLSPPSDTVDVRPGDTVLVTKGAYDGSEATVKQVHEEKEVVTVELTDEPIPIPVELPGSQVRVQQS